MTVLALQVSSAALEALLAVTVAKRAHPELEVPPQLGQRLAGIALRSPEPMLPEAAPVKAPKARRKSYRHPRAKTLPLPEPVVIEIPVDHMREASCCRALLLEIVRRSAYDWVLYRLHSNLSNKKLADDAFHWLFKERPGTQAWRERERSGKHLTSFLNICECLDLDPDIVRGHIRKLTIKNVMSVGRPAERRHSGADESMWAEHQLHLSLDTIVRVGAI